MAADPHISRWPGATWWERLEWHLGRHPWAALGIDLLLHGPRRALEVGRWKKRQTLGALSRFEQKTYSQFGEDGAIAEIFRRIGEGDRFSVEFGIGDGSECCTRNLLAHRGWDGVLIEASDAAVERARRLYRPFPGARVVQSFITTDNILGLFEAAGVPQSPDLLVIDIDGNDYWIWERILGAYRPRVTVIEYNARWRPPREWVMPYDPRHRWFGSAYFGASLASMAKLGATHGYALVGCSSTGVNAYFIREDLVGDGFPEHVGGASLLYAPPRYGRGYGHPIRECRPRA